MLSHCQHGSLERLHKNKIDKINDKIKDPFTHARLITVELLFILV